MDKLPIDTGSIKNDLILVAVALVSILAIFVLLHKQYTWFVTLAVVMGHYELDLF